MVVPHPLHVDALEPTMEGRFDDVTPESVYTLRWDNSYSLVRHKEVKYRFLVTSNRVVAAAELAVQESQSRSQRRARRAAAGLPLAHLAKTLEKERAMNDEERKVENERVVANLEQTVMDIVSIFIAKPDSPLHEGAIRPFILALEAVLCHGIKEEFLDVWPEAPFYEFLIETQHVLRDDMGIVAKYKPENLPLNKGVLQRAFENLTKRRTVVEKYYESRALLYKYDDARRIASFLSALNGVTFLLAAYPHDECDKDDQPPFPRNLKQCAPEAPLLGNEISFQNDVDGDSSVVRFMEENPDEIKQLQNCSVPRYILHGEPFQDIGIGRSSVELLSIDELKRGDSDQEMDDGIMGIRTSLLSNPVSYIGGLLSKKDKERARIANTKRKHDDDGGERPEYAALRRDPSMDKYFKMLSFGVPSSGVAQKMTQDEMPPDKIAVFVTGPDGSNASRIGRTSKKERSGSRGLNRRDSTFRKVYWTSLDTKKANETIWARVTARRKTAPITLSPQDFQELEFLFGNPTAASPSQLRRCCLPPSLSTSNKAAQPYPVITQACYEVLRSERLARCFELVLAIGNLLNTGTELEGAQGITLASLLKLSETKAIDQSMTLLQFSIKLIHDRGEGDVLLFTNDLSTLAEARRYSNVICDSQARALQHEIIKLEQEIKEDMVEDLKRFNGAEALRKRQFEHRKAQQHRPAMIQSNRELNNLRDGTGTRSALLASIKQRHSDSAADQNGAFTLDPQAALLVAIWQQAKKPMDSMPTGNGVGGSSKEDEEFEPRQYKMDSKFISIMRERLMSIKAAFEDIEMDLEALHSVWEGTARYLAEDSCASSTEYVFGLLNRFLLDVKVAKTLLFRKGLNFASEANALLPRAYVGSIVATKFGSGIITALRVSDKRIEVKFPWSREAYLEPSSILSVGSLVRCRQWGVGIIRETCYDVGFCDVRFSFGYGKVRVEELVLETSSNKEELRIQLLRCGFCIGDPIVTPFGCGHVQSIRGKPQSPTAVLAVGGGSILHQGGGEDVGSAGHAVAIDASMALYQFLIAIRSANGGGPSQALTNADGEVTSHLQGMFSRTIRMMENGLKPVYVFDGKPPVMKSGELAKRSDRRQEAQKALEEATEKGNAEDIDRFNKRLVRATPQHNEDCKELLRLMGVPHITAPCEAEASCAALAKGGRVYAAGTEDMDALTFGVPVLYVIRLERALQELEMTHEQFVDLCILCGCDYCDSIRGVGPKKAYAGIKEHKSIENFLEVLQKNKSKGVVIPDEWLGENPIYKNAREMFIKPEVVDAKETEIKWRDPQETELVDFLVKKHGFQEDRSKSTQSQKRLDSFFTVLPSANGAKKRKAPAAKGGKKAATAKKGKK
ncbi:hypothetical protein PInf_012821 [Phytophthora infestans]|nr:hypothetical protein PInf_012821 [Phytophthora infestans]